MNNKIAVLLAGLTVLGIVGQATAQDIPVRDNETRINVTITDKTAVDISPESLDFGDLQPGQNATVANGADGNTYTALEVENVGSTNITSLYFNASAPSTNPFGTGIASNYDVGNWIQIAPQETSSTMPGIPYNDTHHFVNRVDFNESNDLSYVNVPDNFDYGRFRVGNEEYFWAVDSSGTSGVAGACGTTGSDTFRVGTTPHTVSQTGTVDLSSVGGNVDGYDVGDHSGGDYGIVPAVDVGSKTYDVIVNCEGPSTKTVRTAFNPQPLGASDTSTVTGAVSDYVLNSSRQNMYPGNHFTTNVSVHVPRGVASSTDALSGRLSVIATS